MGRVFAVDRKIAGQSVRGVPTVTFEVPFEFVVDPSKGEGCDVYMSKLKNALIDTFSNIVNNMPEHLLSIELGEYSYIWLDENNENSPVKYFGKFFVETYLTEDMVKQRV